MASWHRIVTVVDTTDRPFDRSLKQACGIDDDFIKLGLWVQYWQMNQQPMNAKESIHHAQH